MGVPKFFRYISERYPCLSELVRDYQIPEFDHLYLDMNGIIHICSHPNDGDAHFRISEEKIFQDIFHYIEVLFRMIKPKRLFFMAVDGVAPRAKMNQQRGRRFRSAKEAEKLEKDAMGRGEQLPTEARFDSNCITPGTVFMARLHEQLKYFVVSKISSDKLWQGCKVILSGHETPGEGEHKIMDYIRYMRSQPDYDPNTRHCLYGLDADLLMLGMCTHEPHFCLLREEVKFGKKSTKRQCVPEEINFYLLHLSLMREYLDLEFAKLKTALPFGYDIEKIIDDWVLMGFLVGNDFIPHLPNMHIANGALPILYNAYIKVLPTLDGYINEGGMLNLERFEKYLESLRSIDIDNFSEHYADLKFFEAKTGRRPNDKERTSYKPKSSAEGLDECSAGAAPNKPMDSDLAALIKATDAMFTDLRPESKCVEPSEANLVSMEDDFEEDYESDVSGDDDLFNEEFRLHKMDYYMNKLEYAQVTPEVLKSQAEGYVRAIQWNLNYYYNGVCSWAWFYPHHYAPYLSDIQGFTDLKLDFELGTPFKPYEQLLAVLPSASKSLLPTCYQDLMTSEKSPLQPYYPMDFKTDLNGKRQDWEAVVLIPFIDEDVLLSAMEPCNKKLSLEEIKRNTHRPMLIYSFTEKDLGTYEPQEYFPPITSNHAECVQLSIDDIRVPREKLVKGRYPGIERDVFYPGFPSFRHLNYSGSLEKAKVKVFEQPSRGDNMIVTVLPKETPCGDSIAREILGRSVFVNWPHLLEALAVAVINKDHKYTYVEGLPGQYNMEAIKSNKSWDSEVQGIVQRYKSRLGIETGETECVVEVKVMVGYKCMFGSQGQAVFTKQWSSVSSTYPYQTIVTGIDFYDKNRNKSVELQSLFQIGSECFLLAHPYYGAVGRVMDSKDTLAKGRLIISVQVAQEPDLQQIIAMEYRSASEYMQLGAAASRLSMSRNVFSRVTGTIYLVSQNDTSDSSYKTNLGLNLKFNVRNLEVPGYTKRIGTVWYYSQKAVDLVESYFLSCPELFDYLNKTDRYEEICKENLFPQNCEERVKEVKEWLKQQPHNSLERHICGSEIMEPEIVKKLEAVVDAHNMNVEILKKKNVTMQIKPFLLYKPGLQIGNLPPDPTVTYRLCDRVVNVRESYTVPLGLKGTVTAIHKSQTGNDSDIVYDVLFDTPFTGGMSLNSSPNRSYRLPATAMINLSHGTRVYLEKTGKPGKLMETLKAANNLNFRNFSQNPLQNSAFASFMDVNRLPTVPVNDYRYKQYPYVPNTYQNLNQQVNQPTTVMVYAQPFNPPYQNKTFNGKAFPPQNTPIGSANRASSAPGNMKNHNNFMPTFTRAGVANVQTKEPVQLKIEKNPDARESQGKKTENSCVRPQRAKISVDTEMLRRALGIKDEGGEKVAGFKRESPEKLAQFKPPPFQPKAIQKNQDNLPKSAPINAKAPVNFNVPAPPQSWVQSSAALHQKPHYNRPPPQLRQPGKPHFEREIVKIQAEKPNTKATTSEAGSTKNVFVPLQATKARLKHHSHPSSERKPSEVNSKKNEASATCERSHAVHNNNSKQETLQDGKTNAETKPDKQKRRKVRTVANFSVKMSIP